MGPSVPGMSQGNLSGAQMVQSGNGTNQNVMSGLGPSGVSSGSSTMIPTPGMPQQAQSGMQSLGVNNNSAANMPLSQQTTSAVQPAQSKYVKVWEGNLSGQRQGQPVFITKLEGYRSASASETLASNWPPTMQIVRLISQDHMNNKQYVGKADFLVFQAMNQHGFLGQLQEKKLSCTGWGELVRLENSSCGTCKIMRLGQRNFSLGRLHLAYHFFGCAVIQLPSQTLLLSVSDKACRLIGMLFPGNLDMVVFKPQISSQQQQMQQQHHQQMPPQQHPQLQQQQLPQLQQQQQLPQLQQQQQLPQMQQQHHQQMPPQQHPQLQPQQLPQLQQQQQLPQLQQQQQLPQLLQQQQHPQLQQQQQLSQLQQQQQQLQQQQQQQLQPLQQQQQQLLQLQQQLQLLQLQQQVPQQQQLVGTGMGQAYVQGPGRSQLVSQGQVSSQGPTNMPGGGFMS
ncbi:hypothetical protein P3X46_031313 [Hevea brasiliensis]|uniref:Mediator of RNA polymerase II transcription subunit 25 n=1 Tax=Hevea brasiliensis TaxID=3981 RepID=A0ABQ9KL35_HEVBR|nr:hypothetical protein P3X46_031313 [Hevea brasiliensis]